MRDEYTQSILDKAAELTRLEAAALALPAAGDGWRASLRTMLAAALGALLALIPSVSAAQMIF